MARAVFGPPGGRRRPVSDARRIAASVVNGQRLMRARQAQPQRAGERLQAA
ncbi:MAG: hypothetical protein Kow0073_16000 [Immundisolibacter sp.]